MYQSLFVSARTTNMQFKNMQNIIYGVIGYDTVQCQMQKKNLYTEN